MEEEFGTKSVLPRDRDGVSRLRRSRPLHHCRSWIRQEVRCICPYSE